MLFCLKLLAQMAARLSLAMFCVEHSWRLRLYLITKGRDTMNSIRDFGWLVLVPAFCLGPFPFSVKADARCFPWEAPGITVCFGDCPMARELCGPSDLDAQNQIIDCKCQELCVAY